MFMEHSARQDGSLRNQKRKELMPKTADPSEPRITDSSARTDSSVQASLQGCRPEIDLLTEWAKQTAVMLNEYGES